MRGLGEVVIAVLMVVGSALGGTYGGGSGTPEDPYQIWTAEQMNDVGFYPEDWGKHFILMQDIDYDDLQGSPVYLIGHRYTPLQPYAIQLDHVNEKLYWIDYEKGEIGRSNLNGTLCEVTLSGLSAPRGLAIDFNNGKMYWTNSGEHKIQRANLDGSDIEDLIVTGLDLPFRIALNFSEQKMYWTDLNAKKIQRANFDGSQVEDVIETSYQPYAIIFDSSERTVYWIDGKLLKRSGLDGQNRETLYTGTYTPTGLAIDDQEEMLYWTERYAEHYVTDVILRGSINGGEKQVFLNTGSALPENISFDEVNRKLYWLSRSSRTKWGRINCTDIDTVHSTNVLPRSGFYGNFDGGHHRIANFSYSGPLTDDIGLFCYVQTYGSAARISDVTLVNPRINIPTGTHIGALIGYLDYSTVVAKCRVYDGQIIGQDIVGGLVGYNSAKVEDCNTTCSVTGNDQVGGICGQVSYGSLSNCHSAGRIEGHSQIGGLAGFSNRSAKITASSSSCDVSGIQETGGLVGTSTSTITDSNASGHIESELQTGGLVGVNAGSIEKSYAMTIVTGLSDIGGLVGQNNGDILGCYARCDVSGDTRIGGLVGQNTHSIDCCYSSSAVRSVSVAGGLVGDNTSSGLVHDSYSSGTVDAESSSGGLIGSGNASGVVDSFWDVTCSGLEDSAGGYGKSTETMMCYAFYYGVWTCSPVPWVIEDGKDYPHLFWENTPGNPLSEYSYSGGMGIATDPYRISSLDDLIMLSRHECNWDRCFRLTNDIICSQDPNHQFQIAGPFTGMFDGNGHVIHNYTWTGDDLKHGGLFGRGGCVTNLGMENVSITAHSGSNVGAIMGYSGTISNCYSTGTISIPLGTAIGGLAGNACVILNSYSQTNTNGQAYVGGLIGRAYGGIDRCYSTGLVTGTTAVGGFAGYSWYPTVTSCFWDMDSSGCAIGLGEYKSTYPDVAGMTTAEMKSIATYHQAGWDFVGDTLPDDEWVMLGDCEYPVLVWQVDPNVLPTLPAFSGGNGTSRNPFLISNVTDLNCIGSNPRLMDKHFLLTSDIDCQGQECHAIGNMPHPFRGSFDGNGFIISNVDINADATATYMGGSGFFGAVGCGGSIKNLGLQDIIVHGSSYVGGLVGYNQSGYIQQCFVLEAEIHAGKYAGGLAGYNDLGAIDACYVVDSLLQVHDYAGGIAGYSSGNIQNCIAAVTMNDRSTTGGLVGQNMGTVAYCFSSSCRPGGGLIGINVQNASVVGSFFDIERSTKSNGVAEGSSEGIIGCTTAEAMNPQTFIAAGWDFGGMWSIYEGISYPFLTHLPPNPEACRSPTPSTGQTKVSLSISLSWIPGAGSTSYEIYFGTEDAVQYQGTQTENSFAVSNLQPNTDYYWRVDSVGPGGTKTGTVWTFRTFPWYGSGDSSDPYQIWAPIDLVEIGYDEKEWDKHFVLMNDLDMGVETGKEYKAIGYFYADNYPMTNKPFTGAFDGNGHTIMNFSRVSTNHRHDDDEQRKGVFEYINGGSAKITNLTLENPCINNAWIGGSLAAVAYNATILDCRVEGGHVGGRYRAKIGGLVGQARNCHFSNCTINTTIQNDGGFAAGGLAGYSSSSVIDSCSSSGSVMGQTNVGGLVGYSADSISSSYSTSTITGLQDMYATNGGIGGLVGFGPTCSITDSHTNCQIASYQPYVGGLCGRGGTIKSSYSEGLMRVKADISYVGGLIGAEGTVHRCYSKCNILIEHAGGSAIGGLAGSSKHIEESYSNGCVEWNNKDVSSVGGISGVNAGTILNCYATGFVTGREYVGGIVGMNGASGAILQCYSIGRVSSVLQSGGLVGGGNFQVYYSYWDKNTSRHSSSYGGIGKTTVEMQRAVTFEGWGHEGAWTLAEGSDYPHLAWEGKPGTTLTDHRYSGGLGTHEQPYLISTTVDMISIAGYQCDWDKHFKLTTDIDLAEHKGEVFMIGTDSSSPFRGHFDGDNHSLCNLNIIADSRRLYYGLFGYVNDANALIKNLVVRDSIVSVPYEALTDTVRGVGTIVGQLQSGRVVSCSVEGGTISADCFSIGGMVGVLASGIVTDCHADIEVYCQEAYNCDVAGGLIGTSHGIVEHCSAAGDMYGDATTGGLIGEVGNGCTVRDCCSTGLVRDGKEVGGLIGRAYTSYICRSFATGNVSSYGYVYIGGLIGTAGNNTVVENCHAIGDVTANGSNGIATGGGLIGEQAGTIRQSYATGAVCGHYAGGLVANNKGFIYECYSTGAVLAFTQVSLQRRSGGVAGINSGVITDSYSHSPVKGSGYNYLAGLVGENKGFVAYSYSAGLVDTLSKDCGGLVGVNTGRVIQSYWDVEASGTGKSAAGEGHMTDQMMQSQTYKFWGYDKKWVQCEGHDYPHLAWEGRDEPNMPSPGQVYEDGEGTSESPFVIGTAEQLNKLGLLVSDWEKCFRLNSNVDMSTLGSSAYNQIGVSVQKAFNGIFDGNGYTISNLKHVDDQSCVGLFGCVGSRGRVCNFVVCDVNIGADGDYVGGLVGINQGLIEHCRITGELTASNHVGGLCGKNDGDIKHAYASGTVQGGQYVGGIVGTNNGAVSACHADNNIAGTHDIGGLVGKDNGLIEVSSATGTVNATGNRAGGLVGYFDSGKISESYATGDVAATGSVGGLIGYTSGGHHRNVYCCYAKGSVTGNSAVGGLIGTNSKDLYHCYAVGLVTGQSSANGLIGTSYYASREGCLWDIETTGYPSNYQGIGLTTSEMQMRSTYTNQGWDFIDETDNGSADVWRLCEDGTGYPRLTWEFGSDYACPDGVALNDLLYLSNHWLESDLAPYTSADRTGDGKVDIEDYALLAQEWMRME